MFSFPVLSSFTVLRDCLPHMVSENSFVTPAPESIFPVVLLGLILF